MQTSLRSIFLTSADPESTARFYREVAGLDLEEIGENDYRYWRFEDQGLQVAIHDAKAFSAAAFPPNNQSNLTHLYFRIADRAAFLEHAQRLEVPITAADELVITVRDPDGRNVLFGTP